MEELNRIKDKSKIYPKFLSLVSQLIINCKNRGLVFYVISDFRTEHEQNELFSIGRTKPGKKVTNAKAFESFHNFGLAVDLCRDKDKTKAGLQPDWDLDSYKILQEECHKLGLVSGLDFKSFPEGPHVQLKISIPLSKLKEIYMAKKSLEAVWKELEN